MAQIMETKYRQLGLMQQLFDLMSQDGLVEISPILVVEDQVVALPGPCTQSFLFLSEAMRLERTDGDIRQRYRSSGTGCFRHGFTVLMPSAFCAVVIGQRTGHMHGSLTKINIRPVQRQQFSLEINEQLGNRDGMASSYGQLGMLLMETGNVEEALKYTLSSLLFFLQLLEAQEDEK